MILKGVELVEKRGPFLKGGGETPLQTMFVIMSMLRSVFD